MARKFKVDFYLRSNYVNKEGKTPIMVRIFGDGRIVSIGSTGQAIEKDRWSQEMRMCNGRTQGDKAVNFQLKRIEGELTTIFHKIEYSDKYDIEQVKSIYLSASKDCKYLLEFYDLFVKQEKERVGKTLSAASIQKYDQVRNHLVNFINESYRRKDMLFTQLNAHFAESFFHYMTTKGELAHNTAMRRIRTLKTVMFAAIREGLLKSDPFIGFKVHFKPVDRGFLTKTELSYLMGIRFEQFALERTKDLFIFSCFTGLSYIDVVELTHDKIREINGMKWIVTKRKKTNITSQIPLLPQALAIIDKYRKKRKGNLVFPTISNQHANQHLKVIAEQCDLHINLTFHLSRHTFATMALTNGASIESVSKMLGHTNIRTTQHYARIVNQKVQDDMKELEKKLSDLTYPINGDR